MIAGVAALSGLVVSRAASAIGCGETLASEINPAAETEVHSFTAQAGEAVVITVAKTAGGSQFAPALRLFAPGGGQVNLNQSSAFCSAVCVSQALPTGGTYHIDVNDLGGNDVGFYSLTLQPTTGTLNGAACGSTAIDCGQTLVQAIDDLADSDGFTFAAQSGEVVAVTYSKAGTATPAIALFGPNGAVLPLIGAATFCGTPFPGAACRSSALPSTGIYTVVVWDTNLDQTGAYDITLDPIASGQLNGVGCGTNLPCGATLAGNPIDSPGDSDVFTFAARSGEVVALTYSRSGGAAIPQILLFGPTGAVLPLDGFAGGFCSAGNRAGRICHSSALPSDGTYTVGVWDFNWDETGTYDLTLQPLASSSLNGAPCGSTDLPCGATLTDQIDSLADSDGFTFDAVSGESVVLTYSRSAGANTPTIRLFGPTGAALPLNGSTNFCEILGSGVCRSSALPSDGVYTVGVWDYDLNQTGGYNLTLEAVSGTMNGASTGPPTPPAPVCGSVPDGTQILYCGNKQNQTIDVLADSDSFTFDAMAGEVVTLRTDPTLGSNADPRLRLFGPGGEVTLHGTLSGGYCVGSCVSDPIATAGTHTAFVVDSNLDETGGYLASFERCEIKVRANDAYLHVASTDSAVDPIPIDLAKRGIHPLDPIDLVRLGDFQDGAALSDQSTELAGVFSRDDVLDVQSAPHRLATDVVPVNQPPNGGAAAVTAPTSPDAEPTDIPEDFWISRPATQSVPIGVQVPADATHLFIAAPDERYADNSDPDGDFKVMVVPEPGRRTPLLAGLLALAALVRRRNRLERSASA